ncbi:MAG: DEAD/DEAH box helicase family protein [Actinobacteria bacterium]|nr:DEAD/DEAH box helicase family protein [Actinomycetota bacterium]
MKLYLQSIVEDIPFESLPPKWQGFDYSSFSEKKTLFEFQSRALRNAAKGLSFYYRENNSDKALLLDQYISNGYEGNLDYVLEKKEGKKAAQYLLEYSEDYPVKDKKISFESFLNRMSFWMATGSGKTLIIVKLIELLGKLSQDNEIPQNDILFLAHRDDLLEQFRKHIEEFNKTNTETKINLKSLKDYENVKRDNVIPFFKNEITIFYYRSDLISDVDTEKIVDYKNYDNSGNWYILLDEAHKGDKEDSKRQVLYSILSRNGFLFNFSATFTDPRDFATCVFDFNLSKYVEDGYGKHIYVSDQEVTAFKDKDDFSKAAKQKVVLKTLLLQTYILKFFDKVRRVDKSLYHRPLLLTLVNSVDTKEADLKLFFSEVEKIAKNEIKESLFNEAKEELIEEMVNGQRDYLFESDLSVSLNKGLLNKIEYGDILKQVFNSKTPGNIEVLKIPGNTQEIIFKLKTSDKPFGLIKIGDISGWLKEKLSGYEIIESFENESIFHKINDDDSEINLLMGSRAFYEGWDSSRPNILLFVNIGVGSDSKKFVLQSVGRGVRIEPEKDKRKRLTNLLNAQEVDKRVFEKVKNYILPLESLFVFGTNAENLKEIIKALKEEKQEKDLGQEFIVNQDALDKILLIPKYKSSKKIFAEEQTPQKFSVNKEDLILTKKLFDYLGEKISMAKYECDVKVIKTISKSLKESAKYYDDTEKRILADPELLLDRILDYLSVRDEEFDSYQILENEIVHFRKIKFKGEEKFDQILRKIKEVKQLPKKEEALKKAFDAKELSFEEMLKKAQAIKDNQSFECNGKKLKINYIKNHYYIPLIISENEKVDFINHVIDVESEVKFIEQLEEYLQVDGNIFENYDWWLFSKLDQTLDKVFIPYYNPKDNRIAQFMPDFIFWMKKGDKYTILFVDPKGTEHTDAFRKIDGFSKIFEIEKGQKSKTHKYNGFSVEAKLLLKPKSGIASVPESYRRYWFDNFPDFAEKIVN